MGNHVPTSTPANTTFAYWAGLVDAKLTTLFNDLVGFNIDASGNTAGRATHDGEAAGFVYFDSQAGLLYQKQSATSADWSDGITIGAALLNIVEDATPELGGDLDLNAFDVNGTGGKIELTSAVTAYLAARWISTNADALAGPIHELYRNSPSPANADLIGELRFTGENNADEKITFAQIIGVVADVADGLEDGGLDFNTILGGTLSSMLDLRSDGLRIGGANARVTKILDEDSFASDDAAALATQQSIKAYTDGKFAQIYTGSYTGDGATSQAITGVGFSPKFVEIWNRETVDNTNVDRFSSTPEIMDDNASGGAIHQLGNALRFRFNQIISLDSDGFTVDDNGADSDPNVNGNTYNFVCIG